MEISREQVNKIMELANKEKEIDIDKVTSIDISKALVEIERKLNFFAVEVNYHTTNKSILIVDDLELSLYQLNLLMKKAGIKTYVARNREEAEAEIKRHKFDYILIDLFLPNSEDGLALISEAVEAKRAGSQKFKIIIVSGSEDRILIDKCYNMGIDGYVNKTENWHTDIFKYINSDNIKTKDIATFNKTELEYKTIYYTLRKFNERKIFEEIIADINSSIISGKRNLILDLEKINVFDQDNTYIFVEIYKICQDAGGAFILTNPSEKIKEALATAYLEGAIPVLKTKEEAIRYISEIEEKI